MPSLLTITLLLSFLPSTTPLSLPNTLQGFPPCAQTCISTTHGSCPLLDTPCMCTTQVPPIFTCMQGSCSAAEQAATLDFAQELCAQVGAELGANATTATVSTTTSTSTSTAKMEVGTSTSLSSPTPSSSETQRESSTPPSTAPPTPTSLPPGTLAGISLGVLAGLSLLATFSFLLWRRRRRMRVQGEKLQESGGDGHGAVVRLDDMEVVGVGMDGGCKGGVRVEVEGGHWVELGGKEVRR